MSSSFVEWIPNRVMNSICKVSPPNQKINISGTILANSTQIERTFEKIGGDFMKMFNRKAYVHWYT